MKLTEKHIISKNHKQWKVIDQLCFLSKNLYNYASYQIKQHFEETGKFLNYNILEKQLRTTKQFDYVNLPNNSSQQILMVLDRNFKSFFNALKAWKKDKTKFKACPRPPKYKDKVNGRNLVIFTYAQFKFKDGVIYFPKKSGLTPIKTNQINVKQVRIIPRTSCYVIEIIYEKEEQNHGLNKDNYIGIDLGINNLASISSNQPGCKPILVNGKIIKSINQYFNKKKAQIQSQLEKNHKKKTSVRLQKLYLKRSNKIDYYLHHVSKFIIQYCIENDIGAIIIGYNKEWKLGCNIGKVNNQKFISIPYDKLINQIKYKAELNGISVKLTEESYTSKCSALDCEPIQKHDSYVGKRIKRGLFKYSNGLINADVNGSLNILRKVIGDDFVSLINRGFVHNPIKATPL